MVGDDIFTSLYGDEQSGCSQIKSLPMLLINELKRHNQAIAGEIQAAVNRVLERGWYILGPEVEAFERQFAQWNEIGNCVGVANGTEALELALKALDIGPGDQVITVANAGMYGTAAIRAAGAKPVYADVDDGSLTMSVDSLKAKLSPAIKAIIVTHLYGRLADIEELLAVASLNRIPVIEDCAQAHGAARNGKKAGTFGKIGCYSFYPTKNLGALGDGGAMVTGDDAIAARLKQLRQYGWSRKYVAEAGGGRNSRLDEIQAAILAVKLPRLDLWNEKRRAIARRYNDAFASLPIRTPSGIDEGNVVHLYAIRTERRDDLQVHLKGQGIASEVHYPLPDYRQPCEQGRLISASDLPVTERACREILTLPCFPEMTDQDVISVIDPVMRFFAHG